MEIVVISSWYFFEVFNRNFICAMLLLPCLSSSDPVLTEFDENLFLNFSVLLIRSIHRRRTPVLVLGHN